MNTANNSKFVIFNEGSFVATYENKVSAGYLHLKNPKITFTKNLNEAKLFSLKEANKIANRTGFKFYMLLELSKGDSEK